MAMYNHIKTVVNLTKLQKELSQLLPGAIHCLYFENEQVTIHTTRDLTEAEQLQCADTVSVHAAWVTRDIINERVNNAIRFGSDLLVEFATDNVMLGITQAGKTKMVADYCADIMRYIQSGSLYEAINEVDRLVSAGIPADIGPFITEQRLIEFKQRIQQFLMS